MAWRRLGDAVSVVSIREEGAVRSEAGQAAVKLPAESCEVVGAHLIDRNHNH
jgi:hypothetical protein